MRITPVAGVHAVVGVGKPHHPGKGVGCRSWCVPCWLQGFPRFPGSRDPFLSGSHFHLMVWCMFLQGTIRARMQTRKDQPQTILELMVRMYEHEVRCVLRFWPRILCDFIDHILM
jgi:hypothetical protein